MICSNYDKFFQALAEARRLDGEQYQWLNVEQGMIDQWCYYDTQAVYMDDKIKREQRQRELQEMALAGLAKILRLEASFHLMPLEGVIFH